jgi:group I intron endonuclease
MHYYLYKITNLVNDKYYIGVHKTKNLNDGYMGSGKIIRQAIQKYGVDNFKKEILEFFNDSESMLKKEKEIITEDFLSQEKVYNLRKGGDGGFDFITKNKLNLTPESLRKRAEAIKLSHKLKPREYSGKKHSEETKQHLSEKRKKFFENGGEHPKGMLGKKHKEETKKHVSAVLKEKGSMIGKKGLDHPAGGTKWYNDGIKHLRANEHPGEGWIEGRIFKERKKRKI